MILKGKVTWYEISIYSEKEDIIWLIWSISRSEIQKRATQLSSFLGEHALQTGL